MLNSKINIVQSKLFNRNLYLLFFLILLLVNPGRLFSQASIETSIDTTIATVGDQLNLTLNVNHHQGQRITFPDNKKFGEFKVLDKKTSTKKQKNNTAVTKGLFKITTFDTGRVKIPALKVKVSSKSDTNNVISLKSNPILINIISVLPPQAQKEKDIKGPFPIRTVIPWDMIIFASLFILFSVGLFISYKKWKEKHKSVPKINENYLHPPHVLAFKKMKQLRNHTDFYSPSSLKKFYFKLSEILREYMERRFFIYALEMSTSEIIEAKNYFDIENSLLEELEEILKQLDLIKYANVEPDRNDALQYYEKTYNWIEETKHDPFFSTRSGLSETLEELQLNKSEIQQ